MASEVKIRIRNLWKSYGSLQVLKGLDLDVPAHKTIVILGRSGVGKSVLLKQLIGIEEPDEGSIEIDGLEVLRLSKKKKLSIYKQMGMLFQGSALFDSMNVEQNTSFYLDQHTKIDAKEIKDRVENALEMVDLAGTGKKMPSSLSGGMRKRAALARLIVYRPEVMLFDEPTTGLDPITAMQINDLIIKTKTELKATSIVVTHDLRSALEVGDLLALHHDGKILHIASKDEFFKIDDPVVQAFIENATVGKNILRSRHV